VGGHCLPKDSWLLRYGVETYSRGAEEQGSKGTEEQGSGLLRLIPLAREINDGMPGHMAALIEEALAEMGLKLSDAKVALLGVAYLENCDDTRNTPAAPLASILRARGARVLAHDPHVREEDWVESGGDEVPLTRDLTEALKGADCAAVVTRHRPYLELALEQVRSLMRTPVIVDGRNAFDGELCGQNGIVYRGVGKGEVPPFRYQENR